MFKRLAPRHDGFGAVEVLILLLIIIVLSGVGWLAYRHHNKEASHYLTIKRENPLNQPGVTNFSKNVSGASASSLLNDINSLKPVPSGPNDIYNCPMDDGVEYTFTFYHPSLVATAFATSCQWVRANNKTYFSTDNFWKDVSKATGQPIDPDKNFQ